MRKIIPFIGIVFTALLILLSWDSVRDSAVFTEASKGKIYTVQPVNIENQVYLLVWNNESKECTVVQGDSGQKSFELLKVIAGKQIFYQYSYIKDSDELCYGVVCYNPLTEEKQVLAEWLAGDEQWLAFDNNEGNRVLHYAVWNSNEKQVKEYEAELESTEFNWVPIKSAKIETDEPVFGFYDSKHNLSVATLDNEVYVFSSGSSHVEKSTDIIVYNGKNSLEVPAERTCTALFAKIAIRENGICILGMVVLLIFLFLGITHRHSLLIRMYSVVELVLLLVIIAGYAFGTKVNETNLHRMLLQTATERLEDLAVNYIDDGVLQRDVFLEEVNQQNFHEIMLVNKTDWTIKKATRLPDNTKIFSYLDKECLGFMKEANNTTSVSSALMSYQGKNILAIAFYEENVCDDNEALLGFVNYPEIRNIYEKDQEKMAGFGVMVFAFASVVATITLFSYQRRWKKFVDTAHSAAVDKTGYIIPKREAHGMDTMWGSLQEMSKNVEKLDYEKQRSTLAFARFVPNNLAELFDKENLAEVPAGYLACKKGTMVHISMESLRNLNNNEFLYYVNKGIECLREKQNEYKTVILGNDPDNLRAKCFFEGNVDDAVAFAVDLSSAYSRDEALGKLERTMIINNSEYCCGVAGVTDMVLPFAYSKEDELFSTYEHNLRKAGVKIAITESVLSKLSVSSYSMRYIGYINDASVGRCLKLYECLDAHSEAERKVIINTLPFFEKALNLFYSDDFYLARNTFNKVLQMNPKDQIARWYLFNCEFYLNKTDNSNVSYALYDNPLIEQQYQK